MQSGSNFVEFGKNENIEIIDLSPRMKEEIFKDAYWFVMNPKKSNLNSYNTSLSKKSIKAVESPCKRWGHSSSVYNQSILIFGGRHSHRSLANIYSYNIQTLTWNKIEPLGQMLPARDSHSTIIVLF